MNNPYRVIKQLAFVTGFCIVSCTTALAQQSLFLFLQSDNLQPFYVQVGDKVYSSSAIGHVIISGLQDNTCNFELGFPQHTSKPQHFSIPLHNKDHGYKLIKNGADWALYDWQTKETVEALKGSDNNTSLLYGERKKDDAFATLMAAVVNDSAVLYTSIVKKDVETVPQVANAGEPKETEKKPEPVAKTEEKPVVPATPVDTVQKKQEAVVVTQPAADSAKQVKTEPVVHDTIAIVNKPVYEQPKDTLVAKYDPKEKPLHEPPVKANVVKVQEQTKDGETKMVFVDSSQSPAEVVTVYITENKSAPANAVQQAPAGSNANNSQSEPAQPSSKKETEKSPVTMPPAKQDAIETVKKEPVAPATTSLSKEEVAEKIKKETWQQAPEKKASTDTVTIILESRQMKKDTAVKSQQSLYRPAQKETPKPVTRDTAMVQITAPAKQEVAVTTKLPTEKPTTEKPAAEKPSTEDKPVVKTEPVKPAADSAKKSNEGSLAVNKDAEAAAAKAQEPKALYKPTDSVKKSAESKPAEAEKKTESGSKLVMINSDCVRFATDNDVDKIRVKMLAESDLQKRVSIANKYFKTMCLYAKQMKALSELFPTNESKYQFLQMAYPFAADSANFKQLYDLFTEEAWQTRFKTMVHYQ